MVRTKKQMLLKNLVLILFYLAGPLFLVLTNPQSLPLPLILFPFIWLFAAIYIAVNAGVRHRFKQLAARRRIVIAGTSAALPVLLLVFESIHQLTLKDVALVIALIAVTSFYILRADFIK